MTDDFRPGSRHVWLTALVIAGALTLTYGAALDGPFVFDDLTSITANPTIRHLWPLGEVLSPARGTGDTVDGRPLLNLSFAINYAIGGLAPRGYRLANLLIHFANACLVFGIVRRTLGLPSLVARFHPRDTWWLAGACALVWALHPLNTSAVTYIVQRAESLSAGWGLLTCYAFIRSLAASRRGAWFALAISSCMAAVVTKETMVVAPLIVLLYDRTFVAGSFHAAWRSHRGLYSGLFASWLLLAGLVLAAAGRAGTAGFDAGISPWHYLLTQCRALTHYVRQAFWPNDLVFDHGTPVITEWTEVAMPGVVIISVVVLLVLALRRWPKSAFLGVTMALLLAPTSSVLPIATQTIAEHRMYLPLATLITLVVLAASRPRTAGWITTIAVVLVAPVLAFLTLQRNRAYASEVTLWQDTAAKRPDNARAFAQLGVAQLRAGDGASAEAAFNEAIRLDPENAEAHTNLGILWAQSGRLDDAIRLQREAVRLRPRAAAMHANLAQTLLSAGKPAEALPEFEAARQLDPHLTDLVYGIGVALLELGRHAEAARHLAQAAEATPDNAEVLYHYGNALVATDRATDAMGVFERAVRIDPPHVPSHNNLGNLLLLAKRPEDAVPHFELVVRQQPRSAPAHTNLALALIFSRDRARAEQELRTALALDSGYAPARSILQQLQAAP